MPLWGVLQLLRNWYCTKKDKPKAADKSVRRTRLEGLVSQRHHVFVALTERGNALKPAFRLREHPDRTIAIDRVSVIGKVPAAAFAGLALRDVRVHGWLRRKAVRALQRN